MQEHKKPTIHMHIQIYLFSLLVLVEWLHTSFKDNLLVVKPVVERITWDKGLMGQCVIRQRTAAAF